MDGLAGAGLVLIDVLKRNACTSCRFAVPVGSRTGISLVKSKELFTAKINERNASPSLAIHSIIWTPDQAVSPERGKIQSFSVAINNQSEFKLRMNSQYETV